MNQKNGKESVQDFIARTQTETIQEIASLNKYISGAVNAPGADNGLGISDFGSKLSKAEGKLELIRHLAYLVDDDRA